MEMKPLKKDKIYAKVKGFTPSLPDIVSINFTEQTITVLDAYENEHVLPFDEVELYEEVEQGEPL